MKKHDSLFLGSIAFLLPLLTSFVAIEVAWLFFGDIRGDAKMQLRMSGLVRIIMVILTITPILLFLKAFFSQEQQICQCLPIGNSVKAEIIGVFVIFTIFWVCFLLWNTRWSFL